MSVTSMTKCPVGFSYWWGYQSWLYQGKDTYPVISTSLNKILLIKIM